MIRPRTLAISFASLALAVGVSAVALMAQDGPSSTPGNAPSTNSDVDRRGETRRPSDQSVAVVYPVHSIEEWKDNLPVGRIGDDARFQLKSAREMIDVTHFPYRAEEDPVLTRVNFQREMNFLFFKGAELLLMEDGVAYFRLDNVAMSPEARWGYRD